MAISGTVKRKSCSSNWVGCLRDDISDTARRSRAYGSSNTVWKRSRARQDLEVLSGFTRRGLRPSDADRGGSTPYNYPSSLN
jgi:hypothetical protein